MVSAFLTPNASCRKGPTTSGATIVPTTPSAIPTNRMKKTSPGFIIGLLPPRDFPCDRSAPPTLHPQQPEKLHRHEQVVDRVAEDRRQEATSPLVGQRPEDPAPEDRREPDHPIAVDQREEGCAHPYRRPHPDRHPQGGVEHAAERQFLDQRRPDNTVEEPAGDEPRRPPQQVFQKPVRPMGLDVE